MMYEDICQTGRSFAKDPCVVKFGGRYFMYYSASLGDAFCVGIAESHDLDHWKKLGDFRAEAAYEGKGVAAPGAIVKGGVIHLFYQSYGQFPKEYICHATSVDGVKFVRDATNPIVKPEGDWNIGRAIDADVVKFGDKLLLYWATRDPAGMVQQLGVSAAPWDGNWTADEWTQICDKSILKPEMDWEQVCIEAPATFVRDNKVYMLYGGAYNCMPQQIGRAVSGDGVNFTRIGETPLLGPGTRGSWNASESGHPYVFDDDGRLHLFYQGSEDGGATWRLSRAELVMKDGAPVIA